jgi:hypothetical protein
MDQEVYNTFQCLSIATVIAIHRSEGVGLVVRMDSGRTVRKIMEGEAGGGR